MHFNIQCLTNKINLLECLLKDLYYIDIICISEHWMTHTNCNYPLNGYINASTYCRTTLTHGGVCIFVKECIPTVELTMVKNLSIELHCDATAVAIKKKNLAIICVYRSPNGDIDIFCNVLDKIVK